MVAEAASKPGFGTFLLTNGILLRRYEADFYRKFINNIRVSLDGGDELTHSATRGRGHFEKVISNIAWLVEHGIRTSVQMTLTKSNMDSAEELRKRLPPQVPLRYTPLFPIGRGQLEQQSVCPDDFITPEEFYAFSRRTDTGGLNSSATPQYRQTGCSAGRSNISIDDNGDVYPCHLFHEERFRLGNLLQTPLRELLYSDSLRAYVKSMHVDHNNPHCAQCSVRYLCGGGCKANALHESGDHRGREQMCGYLQANLLNNLFDSYSTQVS